MMRAIDCIMQEHDPELVALALLICVMATGARIRLLGGGAAGHRHDRAAAWISTAALTISCGVWTTHFLGKLAFSPGLPSTFDLMFAALSLVLVATPAHIAFSIWSRQRSGPHKALRRPDGWGTAIATGLLIDTGIGLMHFVGMRSLPMPALVHYDPALVVAALGLGALFSITAMRALERKHVIAAALLLALSVGAVHFVAMAAITLEPASGIEAVPSSVSRSALAAATGGGCVMILAMALLAFRLDRNVSARLAEEANRFRVLADATFEGLIFERAGRIVDTNRAMCRLMGVDADMLVGRPVATVISGGVSMHPSRLERPTEYELIQQDGGTRPVEVLWRTGPDPNCHVMAIRDISREKAAQQQIQRLAQFDTLTDVGNRRLLEQTLQNVLATPDRATGVALLYADLDRFRTINDLLGPAVGDAILVQAVRRLSALAGDADTVARVGGDEFAIIHPLGGQPSEVAALAERVVMALGLPYEVEGQTITIGGSVGVAMFPANGTTNLSLMTSAALALNRAKQDGRNTWRYFEPEMDSLLRERRALESDLHLALVEGQLRLAYQPFFHANTLQIAGYEALLRWEHPVKGSISPVEFIPIAEESGLIVPIGQWVLHTACAEAASWGSPLVIAVNLSPAQFGHGIVRTVEAALRESGLAPSRLELEITEGVLMGETKNALDTLIALKALGVTLAMDDFGTGYSSLSYLKRFPFDKLKIDRSFIRDLDDDADGEPIVQAIIAMSRSLRLEVTAEGVETSRQLVLLQSEGCAFVQGFLLGRPLGAQQIDRRSGRPARPPAGGGAARGTETMLLPVILQSSLSMAAIGLPDKPQRPCNGADRLQPARST